MKIILQVCFLSLMLFFGIKGYSATECDAVVEGSAETLETQVLAAAKAKAEAEINSKVWAGAWIPKVINTAIVDRFSFRQKQYWLVEVTIENPRDLSQTKSNYIVRRSKNSPDAEFVATQEVTYSVSEPK